jgi:hypothetical protein
MKADGEITQRDYTDRHRGNRFLVMGRNRRATASKQSLRIRLPFQKCTAFPKTAVSRHIRYSRLKSLPPLDDTEEERSMRGSSVTLHTVSNVGSYK